jgi:hypothetical protein
MIASLLNIKISKGTGGGRGFALTRQIKKILNNKQYALNTSVIGLELIIFADTRVCAFFSYKCLRINPGLVNDPLWFLS